MCTDMYVYMMNIFSLLSTAMRSVLYK